MNNTNPALHPFIHLFRHAGHRLAGTVNHRVNTVKNKYHTYNPRYDK
jgi:hypothetical protein